MCVIAHDWNRLDLGLSIAVSRMNRYFCGSSVTPLPFFASFYTLSRGLRIVRNLILAFLLLTAMVVAIAAT